MRHCIAFLLALGLLVCSAAHAQDAVREGPPIVVRGRIHGPGATYFVERSRPRTERSEERPSFVREIERSTRRAPLR